MANLLYISVLIFTITGSALFFSAESKTYPGDVMVLKQLKNVIDPSSVNPGSCLSSWDFNFDPCENLFGEKFTCGFRCDGVDSNSGTSRVTELSLDQAGYSGLISSINWNLPYLEILDLSNNYFHGSIPESFSRLSVLRRLSLSSNMFSGQIPNSIGSLSHLEEIYLDNNRIEGAIPENFKDLTSLTRLELQQNKISGEFPDLGWLKSLMFLDVTNNGISGQIPANFPTSLVQISMRNNSFEGSIPLNIQFLTSLQVMDLSYNKLSGSVPFVVFTHPALQQISLSNNQFTSIQIPSNLGTQSELIAIDMSNNQIQGLLPLFLGFMPKLSALSLENNRFTGLIPTQYGLRTILPDNGSMSRFSRLLLSGNYLIGPFPSPLMKLRAGSAMVSMVDNCFSWCPEMLFFCRGGVQKPLDVCKSFFAPFP